MRETLLLHFADYPKMSKRKYVIGRVDPEAARMKQKQEGCRQREVMRDRIFVGGIPRGVKEQELGDFFSRYGRVTRVGIIPPPYFKKVVSEVSYSNYSLPP